MKPEGVSGKEYTALCDRAQQYRKRNPDCRKKDNLDFFLYVVAVILVLLSLRLYIGEPIQVEGPSMLPTLQNGERMLVEKVSYLFHRPSRGDIIICYYPGYQESCVKRVIGLPGDMVQVVDGIVEINGEPLAESAYWADRIDWDTFGTLVPENAVFVMGDNRNYSKDSRDRSVGCIPYDKILGRAIGVFWPLGGARTLSHDVYPAGVIQ